MIDVQLNNDIVSIRVISAMSLFFIKEIIMKKYISIPQEYPWYTNYPDSGQDGGHRESTSFSEGCGSLKRDSSFDNDCRF